MRLADLCRELAQAGNTVVVVEHDRGFIEAADHVVELGPGSGERGGEIVFAGSQAEFRTPRAR
jgi:excinuclease ABC subunit A